MPQDVGHPRSNQGSKSRRETLRKLPSLWAIYFQTLQNGAAQRSDRFMSQLGRSRIPTSGPTPAAVLTGRHLLEEMNAHSSSLPVQQLALRRVGGPRLISGRMAETQSRITPKKEELFWERHSEMEGKRSVLLVNTQRGSAGHS